MKNQNLKLTAFYFTMTVSMQAAAVQNVYEYQNSEGVTEFTDEVKADKVPEKQFQIKKMTPEEEALSKQKLEQVREKDKELDKRLARERQLENERKLRSQEQRAQEKQSQQQQPDADYDRYERRRYGVPTYPRRPNLKPKPTPLPIRR